MIVIYVGSIVIVFIVTKKIAKTIVKPIKETFDKQTEFISDASHELKIPLAVIRANVDVIEKEFGKSKWITYVQNEVDSMSKLINEMLLLSKIDNAIKHTDSGNNVKIIFAKDKDGFKLEVLNQGEEIPKAERKRIFERFYRVDKARNREEKRYGLGLSIAKATCEKYNGTIEVDYKDGYTIFRIKI